MPLTRITHASPPETRAHLDDLLLETFGFSLAGWHARGCWTTDYACWALVEEGRVQANAGVYRMEMLVRGEKQVWMQLGAVATRKEQRGRGLSHQILEAIFAQHPHAPFFLFAKDSVVDFYPRFGFQAVKDLQPVMRCCLDNAHREMRPGGMRRVSVDDPLVGEYINGRACFSSLLDCANAAPLNEFHLRLEYADCIYEIPALGVLLVARQRGDTLSIKDVVARQPVTFDEIIPYLGFSGVSGIRFGFNPDWLGVEYEMVPTEEEDATPIFFQGNLAMLTSGAWMLPLMLRS